jgi:hypothetical protein
MDWQKTLEDAGIIAVIVIASVACVLFSDYLNKVNIPYNQTGHKICAENNLSFVSATNATLICSKNQTLITPHYNLTYPNIEVQGKVDWQYYNETQK